MEKMSKKLKTERKSHPKDRAEERLKRMRTFVAVLSCFLFVISLYFIYVSFTSETTELSVSDIKWRLTTMVRLLISLLGYVGAVFKSRALLIVAMALILCDIVVTFGLHYISVNNLNSQYNQYLQYFANMENRTIEMDDKDCDFIKIFRRRIIENLILISFHVIYVDSILTLIHSKEKAVLGREIPVNPHPKWPLILLSIFHLFYSIFLFWSKTFRSDEREEVVQKKGFIYILLWTLLAFLSIFISIVSPFALIHFRVNDKFFLNFFISTVILSIFLGSAKFLLIVAEEFWSGDSERHDYYCNIKLTSADNLGSILILMIINKIIISLLLTLSNEIKKEIKRLKVLTKIDKKV